MPTINGKILKRLILEHGFKNQSAFAGAIGLRQGTVSKYISGRITEITGEVFCKMAGVLNYSPDRLQIIFAGGGDGDFAGAEQMDVELSLYVEQLKERIKGLERDKDDLREQRDYFRVLADKFEKEAALLKKAMPLPGGSQSQKVA